MLKTKAINNRRVLLLSALYGLLLVGSIYAFTHYTLGGGLAYTLAILPALPLIGVFAAIGRYLVEEQDEYVRMLMVRQTLWASGLLLSVATIWGFLEAFELAPHVIAYWSACIWFAGLGIGVLINRLTLGSAVQC
jgi:hypothetical protein